MKEINLLIKNSSLNAAEIKLTLSRIFEINDVQVLGDNTLTIEGDCHVDWEYIKSLNLKSNCNFVFLDEYIDNGYKRDRYVDSGIQFIHDLNDEFINVPLVKYKGPVLSPRPVLFLDRDGILNEDTGYVYKYDDSIIFKDMIEVVKLANKLSIPVVIVTNQAGVARGMYSQGDVDNFHSKLCAFYLSHGATINHIEVCPFHKDHGSDEWKFNSLLRKPNPGMHLKALSSLSGTISNSIMIGDKESDRIKLEGLRSFILSGNYETNSTDDLFTTRQELCENIFKYLNNLLDLS